MLRDLRSAYLSRRPVVIDRKRPTANGDAPNDFAYYRFSHVDIGNMPRIVGKKFAVQAELKKRFHGGAGNVWLQRE